jgi:hypothetical protein
MVLSMATHGCRREVDSEESPSAADDPQGRRVVFPPELRVADDDVNALVRDAIETCRRGDYQDFRLLWSTQVDPMPRYEFETYWGYVDRLRVIALVRDPRPEQERYAVLVEVTCDPRELPPEHELSRQPVRLIALLILPEGDEWRLAPASERLRAWLVEKYAQPPAGEEPTERVQPLPLAPVRGG